jgi:nucleotide-binding universal stress UspA family protein
LSQYKNEFSKILMLLDGSQPSINAADCAIAIVKKERNNGKPQLLIAPHVVFSRLGYARLQEHLAAVGLAIPLAIKTLLEDAKKEAQQWFNKIKEKINNNDNSYTETNNNIQLQTQVMVTATSIVSAIVEYAKNKDVDLIVTGTRGRSQFKNLLIGSVASGVIVHASCPVMIVK